MGGRRKMGGRWVEEVQVGLRHCPISNLLRISLFCVLTCRTLPQASHCASLAAHPTPPIPPTVFPAQVPRLRFASGLCVAIESLWCTTTLYSAAYALWYVLLRLALCALLPPRCALLHAHLTLSSARYSPWLHFAPTSLPAYLSLTTPLILL